MDRWREAVTPRQQENLGNNSLVTGQGDPEEMDACPYQTAESHW